MRVAKHDPVSAHLSGNDLSHANAKYLDQTCYLQFIGRADSGPSLRRHGMASGQNRGRNPADEFPKMCAFCALPALPKPLTPYQFLHLQLVKEGLFLFQNGASVYDGASFAQVRLVSNPISIGQATDAVPAKAAFIPFAFPNPVDSSGNLHHIPIRHGGRSYGILFGGFGRFQAKNAFRRRMDPTCVTGLQCNCFSRRGGCLIVRQCKPQTGTRTSRPLLNFVDIPQQSIQHRNMSLPLANFFL